jgi:hypothetical protein
MSVWSINPPSSDTLAFSLCLAPYCRSCPCDRHDLFLPSIPASLQTLGRCECAAACALAPLGFRIISPLTFYLLFLGAIWTYGKKIGSDLSLSAADSPAFHTGSSASPSLAHSQFPGTSSATPPPYCLLRHSVSSLRLMLLPPATNAPAPRSDSSSPSPTTPPSSGPILSNCPPRLDLYYVHLQ